MRMMIPVETCRKKIKITGSNKTSCNTHMEYGFCFYFLVLGMKCEASHMVDQCFTTELRSSPSA